MYFNFFGKAFEDAVKERIKIYKINSICPTQKWEDEFLGRDLYINDVPVDITVSPNKDWTSQKITIKQIKGILIYYRYANGKSKFPRPVLVVEFINMQTFRTVQEAAREACARLIEVYHNLNKITSFLDAKAIKPKGVDDLPPYDGLKTIAKDGSRTWGSKG